MEWITAVSNGDTKRVEELMNNSHDVTVTDRQGNNALHRVTDPDILSYLLGTSCDINARNVEGDTPLNSWYKMNLKVTSCMLNFDKIRHKMAALIDAGADCNIPNNLGQTALHTVLLYGGGIGLSLTEEQVIDLVTLLIINGHADVSKADYENCTPLHYALCGDSIAAVEILLQSGSDVHSQNVWGGTALHLLCYTDTSDWMNVLFEYGADPRAGDNEGKTCLHIAASVGNTSAMAVILEQDKAQQNNKSIVKPTTEGIPLVDVRDSNGQTAIHLSAVNKNIEATALLIEFDADVNIRDKFGATSLHYGAAGGTIEIVQMLVTAGADTAKVDCNGMTAMEVATGRHYHETAAAIFQAQQEEATACGPSTIETENKCAKLQHYPADNIFNVYIHELSLSTDPFDLSHIEKGLMEEMSNDFQGNFEKYLRGMMHVPGIGKIPDNDEVLQLQTAVEDFVGKLAQTMADIDDRFEGCILKSGSWYEGTKVGDPEEFDFMLCLKHFEEMCNVNVPENQIDDIAVLKKDLPLSGRYDRFFQGDTLQSDELMESFVLLAKRALSKLKYETSCSNLHVLGITEHSLIGDTWVQTGTVTCELKFAWTGPRYKQLIITADLVPALYVGPLPTSSTFTSIARELRETGCHVVSKSGSWRLSFSLAEKSIFQQLSNESKEAYICAKIALHPAVSGRFFIVNSGINTFETGQNIQYIEGGWEFDNTEAMNTGEAMEVEIAEGEVYMEHLEEDGLESVAETNENFSNESKLAGATKIEGDSGDKDDDTYGKEGVEKENLKEEITKEDKEVAGFESDDNNRVDLDEIAGKKDTNTDIVDRVAECESTQSTVFISNESDRPLANDSVAGSHSEQHEGVLVRKLLTTRSHSHTPVTVLRYEDGLGDEETTKEFLSSLEKGSRIEVTSRPHGESPDPEPVDGRSMIPSYLLKLIFLNCMENAAGRELLDRPIVTTGQIFDELKRCLQNEEPVPFFFCKPCDFLKKVVKTREIYCRISFLVSFICALFQDNRDGKYR